jgi:hypothetical protein
MVPSKPLMKRSHMFRPNQGGSPGFQPPSGLTPETELNAEKESE